MSAALETERVTRAMLAAQTRRPWTAEEVAFLRKNYRRRGAKWCAKRIGRTWRGVAAACARHGITEKWSRAELVTLRAEWGTTNERTLRQKFPGRTWNAVSMKAQRIGLPNPNQGVMTIKELVAHTGVDRDRLLSILRGAGVELRYRIRLKVRRVQRGPRQRVADTEAVVEAVEAWLADQARRFTCDEAARHCEVSDDVMRRAMRKLVATRPVDGYRAGRPWSILPEDAAEALALHYRTGGRQ